MLAHKWSGYTPAPQFSQPKIDGVRALISRRGAVSRNGLPFHVPHIMKTLRPFFKAHPNAILDGELWVSGVAFPAVLSAVRQSSPLLQYHVFDVVDAKKTFEERHEWVRLHLRECAIVRLVPTVRVKSKRHLDALHKSYLADGFEGQMVRLWECRYIPTRSAHLLKRKEFQSEEYVIEGVIEGRGKRTGMVGAFEMSSPSGQSFRCSAAADDKTLKKWWRNRKVLVGKPATVRYFELTPRGVPRFPTTNAIRDYEG